ncbi:retrovirus-related pol polyprotein from transposon TNT 1-94 [Tanacetum coccineum]|uniref:Retrovirus-related pol polyprotein from transposon TNT 1-94 n=1 Tax=Tanacetum coccineum TaxID=301880 RepID=A0ABQ5H270_9ASTR
MACDVSWKSKLSTINDENVLLKTQVDFNQDLLIIISELKNKLKTVDKGKNVNTKFDKYETSGILLCVTPLPKNIEVKAKKVSNSRSSSVKRSLFTTPIVAKSRTLGDTSVVAKSRLSVIQLVLWIVDSWCSKHMTGNLQLLRNFVEKFIGTFCFGNDHFAAITGYGDYVQGNLTICHGDDLLTGSRDSNLYTISISEIAASSPVCLISRATSTKCWLWNLRLSHLNFSTINQLTSKDLVDGLPNFKYNKDHICSAYEHGKSKKASLPSKLVPSTEYKLKLLYMDLCRLMRVTSINGKKYILVIVDDYSWYTWVYFLRTKDAAPDMIIDFINQVQRNLKAQILTIRTDNGTEFKNEKLRPFYAKLGSVPKTLIARRSYCYYLFTQNRSIVHTRYNKTPFELIRGRKPNIQYFHVFGSLCYPTNDLGKMKLKADIDLDNFFGPLYEEYYATSSQEVSDNSAANTLDNENTSSSSSIVVEEYEAPQIVSRQQNKLPITQTLQS